MEEMTHTDKLCEICLCTLVHANLMSEQAAGLYDHG